MERANEPYVVNEDEPSRIAARKYVTARNLVNGNATAVIRVLNLDNSKIELRKDDVIKQSEKIVWGQKCSSSSSLET